MKSGPGAGGGEKAPGRQREVALPVCDNKEKRTQVHAIFRSCPFLPVSLATKVASSEESNRPVIVVGVSKGESKRRKHTPWPGGKGYNYVKFVMEKTNCDSQSALDAISRMIRPQKVLGVAGTKDKRAITAQFVTVHRVEPSRLVQLSRGLARINVRIGNFEYATEQLGLGDLSGNRFEIVLRGLALGGPGDSEHGRVLEDVVREAVAQTREHGFLNYYGLQRFGTGKTPTHATGELLLRGKWKEAVEAIMAPGDSTTGRVRKALEDFLDGGLASEALKAMSGARQFSLQRRILEHFDRHGSTDYSGALEAMPKNMRSFFVSAYHSYVWNNVVSERVRTYGAKAVLPGDLVIRRDEVKKESGLGKRKREAQQREGETATVSRMGDPHVVTEEDIKEGRYNIEDVVLPLPGTSVKYPENATAAMYKKYEANLLTEHSVKSFMAKSYSGDYRHILYRPKDLVCKFYRCKSPDEDLPSFDAIDEAGTEESGDSPGGLATVLRFYLPSSTYATMCIREITRMPTDTDFAVSLGK